MAVSFQLEPPQKGLADMNPPKSCPQKHKFVPMTPELQSLGTFATNAACSASNAPQACAQLRAKSSGHPVQLSGKGPPSCFGVVQKKTPPYLFSFPFRWFGLVVRAWLLSHLQKARSRSHFARRRGLNNSTPVATGEQEQCTRCSQWCPGSFVYFQCAPKQA